MLKEFSCLAHILILIARLGDRKKKNTNLLGTVCSPVWLQKTDYLSCSVACSPVWPYEPELRTYFSVLHKEKTTKNAARNIFYCMYVWGLRDVSMCVCVCVFNFTFIRSGTHNILHGYCTSRWNMLASRCHILALLNKDRQESFFAVIFN